MEVRGEMRRRRGERGGGGEGREIWARNEEVEKRMRMEEERKEGVEDEEGCKSCSDGG